MRSASLGLVVGVWVSGVAAAFAQSGGADALHGVGSGQPVRIDDGRREFAMLRLPGAPAAAGSEDLPVAEVGPEPGASLASGAESSQAAARHSMFDDGYHFGVLVEIGTSGAGIQFGIPLVPHVALRVGGDYIRYTGSYQYDAANIAANLQFGYGRASLDYFPWRNRGFHISPLLIFANQTRLQANVAIDPSTELDLGGNSFYGSTTDPLHGTGRVDFRKTSPGVTVGFGNLTHGRGHWTFPVELGAFYNDVPALQVNFTGTACAAGQPPAVGCEQVQNDPDFQTSLQKFRARQEHNLTYAKFLPVFNFGVGYRF